MYSERIAGLKSSAIREILKITSKPGIISFAGGLPAPELFPMEEFSEAARRVLSKYKSTVLQYSITEGLLPLREKIASIVDPDSGSVGPGISSLRRARSRGLILSQSCISTRAPTCSPRPRVISVRCRHSGCFRRILPLYLLMKRGSGRTIF